MKQCGGNEGIAQKFWTISTMGLFSFSTSDSYSNKVTTATCNTAATHKWEQLEQDGGTILNSLLLSNEM